MCCVMVVYEFKGDFWIPDQAIALGTQLSFGREHTLQIPGAVPVGAGEEKADIARKSVKRPATSANDTFVVLEIALAIATRCRVCAGAIVRDTDTPFCQ